jgi:hypothetical protein
LRRKVAQGVASLFHHVLPISVRLHTNRHKPPGRLVPAADDIVGIGLLLLRQLQGLQFAGRQLSLLVGKTAAKRQDQYEKDQTLRCSIFPSPSSLAGLVTLSRKHR